jgi:hypothetical protein
MRPVLGMEDLIARGVPRKLRELARYRRNSCVANDNHARFARFPGTATRSDFASYDPSRQRCAGIPPPHHLRVERRLHTMWA